MATDFLEQLADGEVPPVPVDFDHGVHQRVNRLLLLGHLIGFGLLALPYAMLHFVRGVAGFLELTMTGRIKTRNNDPAA